MIHPLEISEAAFSREGENVKLNKVLDKLDRLLSQKRLGDYL